MKPITPELKDSVLFYLRNNIPLEKHIYKNTSEVIEVTGTDFDSLKAILQQFERSGFFSDLGVGEMNIVLKIRAELHDFAYAGGFGIQEIIFKANIEKLCFEVEHLEKKLGPDHLDALSKISTAASAIFAGLALLPK